MLEKHRGNMVKYSSCTSQVAQSTKQSRMWSKASALSTQKKLDYFHCKLMLGSQSYIFSLNSPSLAANQVRIKIIPFWVNKTAGREIIHNRNVDKFMCCTDNTDNSKEVMGATFWTKCRRRSLSEENMQVSDFILLLNCDGFTFESVQFSLQYHKAFKAECSSCFPCPSGSDTH